MILRTDAQRITDVSPAFYELIKHFEGLRLTAYLDTGQVPTIGIGTTVYPNGKRVALGDKCSEQDAYNYLRHDVSLVIKKVDAATRDDITQGMFDALVSFSYNTGRYSDTTLYKRVNQNPIEYSAITAQFVKWKYDNGKVIAGLLRRRRCEAYLYEHGVNVAGWYL